MNALLVGNGMTSQLIDAYKDIKMKEKFILENQIIYNDLNSKFESFRIKDDSMYDKKQINQEILKRLTEKFNGQAKNKFDEYFIKFGLINEVKKEEILGLENLLKVAKLFEYQQYEEIKNIADKIYFNNGECHINNINNKVDKVKLKKYINEFDYIFTTNYDYLLDDVSEREIFHLHGGFCYEKYHKNGAHNIRRVENLKSIPDEPCLIWGTSSEEKEKEKEPTFSFPIRYPLKLESVLKDYFKSLYVGNFNEIHIWGYSGENDGHINDKLNINESLETVYFYCNPVNELNNPAFLEKIKNIYKNKKVILKSWNEIWDSLKEEV